MGKKDLRIYALLDVLKANPMLSIKELADKFQVSEMTVRRDLEYLKGNHLLYNNALAKPHQLENIYSTGSIKHLDKKERITQYAAKLIEPDDILILDSGTTIGLLPQYITVDCPLTVLCYNLHIFSQLYKKENIALVFPGGYYHKDDFLFESKDGVELIKRTRASKMFVSASGIHEKLGLTCASPYETATKRAAIDSTLLKILLADSSKFGYVQSGYFAQLTEMDIVISDDELSDEWREVIISRGITLHLV